LTLAGVAGYRAAWHLWAGSHFRAARRALDRHDLTAAQAHLTLCLEVWPDSAETHFLAARTARRAGDERELWLHLKECSRLGWPEEALRLEHDLLTAQSGELGGVESGLLAVARRGGDDEPVVLEALAQGYLKTYRLAEALHCLDRLLEREPDHVRALVWRGEVKERRNDLPEAVRSYRRAVEIDPDDDDARLRLAESLTRYDRSGEAVEHFERLLASQPTSARVLLGLARCRRGAGRAAEAQQYLGALLDLHPGHAEALGERGKLALEAGEAAEAERWLRRALALAPFDRDVNYNLAQCLLHQGKADEARAQQSRLDRITADFQRAADVTRQVTASPRDPALRHEVGVLLLRNGQEQEGLRWLYTALQVDPGHRPTHATLADHYERRGQRPEAARHRAVAGPPQPAPEGQRP
jgi:predicted Zn-dependent protease